MKQAEAAMNEQEEESIGCGLLTVLVLLAYIAGMVTMAIALRLG